MPTRSASTVVTGGPRGLRRTDAVFVDDARGLYAVMNGTTATATEGGSNEADVTVDALRELTELAPRVGGWRLDVMADLVTEIDRRVYAMLQSDDPFDLFGWGMSLAMVAVEGKTAWLTHVGRCRVHRMRTGTLQALTIDHSFDIVLRQMNPRDDVEAAALVEARKKHGDMLLQVVGTGAMDRVTVTRIELRPGDLFVLTSPGAHAALTEHDALAKLARDDLSTLVEHIAQRGRALGEQAHREGPENAYWHPLDAAVVAIVCDEVHQDAK